MVASVLLSTTLYLGGVGGNNSVLADTTDNSDSSSQTTDSYKAIDEQTVALRTTSAITTDSSASTSSSMEKASEPTTDASTTSSEIATSGKEARDQVTANTTAEAGDSTTATNEESSNSTQTSSSTPTISTTGNSTSLVAQDTTSLSVTSGSNTSTTTTVNGNGISATQLGESKVTNTTNSIDSESSVNLAENGKITLSKTTIGNDGTTGSNRSITGHLYLTIVHAGDVFKITIPRSSTYASTGVTAPASSSNFAVTTKNDDPNNWYIIVQALNDSDHADIKFTINAENNNYTDTGLVKDSSGLLTDVGTKTYNVVATGTDANGNDLGSVSSPDYQAIVKPQFNDITYTANSGIKDNVAVVNRELSYTINVHEALGIADGTSNLTGKVNKRVNHGSIITIPMPKGFVLNVADTQAANESGVTFSQDSNGNVIINASKATGDLSYQPSDGYVIKGSYNIDTPDTDTTLTASGPITVKQVIDDNGTTITGTGTSVITQVIVGKKSNYDGKIMYGWSTNVELYPYGYSYGTKKAITGKYNNPQLAQYTATNNSLTQDVTNPTVTINVPNGLAVTSFNVNDNSTTGVGTKTYTIYYEDGTSESGTVSDNSQLGNGKTIKQIIVKAEELPSLSSMFVTTWGNTAETYHDGTKTGAGFTLNDTNSFTGDNIDAINGSVDYHIDPLSELKAKASFAGLSRNNSNNRSDFYQVYFVNGFGKIASIKDPVFYYVLPTGVYFNGTITNLQGNPTITTETVNGHQVVKVDYTGTNTSYKLDTGNGIGNMNLGVNGDAINGNYTVEGFIKSSETVLDNDPASKASDTNADYFGGSLDNVYYIGQATFPVTAISSLSPVALISGNKDKGLLSGKGNSDDKGSTAMQIGFNIVNNEATSANGDVMYVNVPSNGLFKVTGPVVAPAGLSGYTIYYSKSATDLSNAKVTDITNSGVWTSDTSGWTAADWAQVKSIAVSLPDIAGNTNTGRFIINGEDPTLAQDAGKTLAVASAIASPLSKTLVVNETSNSAPKLTISGTSTIKTALQYTDADGQTHTITLNYTKQYTDNSSTMSYSDFPNTITDFSSEDQATINDLIAKGYQFNALGTGNNTILNNGGQTWQTDISNAPDDSATWGSQVKYYFDGDTVVYTLTHQQITVTPNNGKTSTDKLPNESGKNYPDGVTNDDLTKTVTRTINIYGTDGKLVKTDTQRVKVIRTATVDAVTGGFIKYSDWKDESGNTPTYVEYTYDTPAGYSGSVTYKNTNTTDTTSGKVTTEPATDKDGNPVDETVDVKFTANPKTTNIVFKDQDNNNEVVKTVPVEGHTSETVTVDGTKTTIPDGYELVDKDGNVIPTTITFTGGDSTTPDTVVYLKHKHDITTKTINKEITYQTTDGKQVTTPYTTSTTITRDYDEINKTYTYKVNGQEATTADLDSQDVPAAPTGYHLDTNQSTGDYNKTTSYDLASQFSTLTDGQTVNAKVVYAPDTENVKVRYETADGKTLADSETKSGYYGSSYETSAKTITGYHLTKTPSNATGTYGITNDDVIYVYVPDNETVNVKYVDQKGKVLVPSDSKNGDYGSSYETSAKTITGYHLIKTPSNANGTYGTTNDDVVYTYAPDNETVNIKYVDQNGKELLPSDSKNGDFGSSYETSAKTITGYHLTKTPANASGTYGTTNDDVVYTYAPDKQTITVTVHDSVTNTDVTIPTTIPTSFDGTTGGTVDITDGINKIKTYLTEHGYTVPDKIDIPTNFDNTDNGDSNTDKTPQPVTITVGHKTTIVNPNSPKTTNDNLPDNPGKNYPDGVTETDLNKTITRTIVEVDPLTDEHKTVATQPVHYTRTATVDEVTGKVTYTDWTTTDKWGAYTPSQKSVDETTPSIDDKDQTVTITYTANPTNTTVVFVDDNDNGKTVKTVPVNGVTGGTTPLSNDDQKIPNGYELVDGNKVPTEVKFNNDGSQTPDTTIHLKHKTVTVTPDKPAKVGDKLPDNPNQTYPTGIETTKTVTRTINVHKPDGTTETTTQTVTFTRTVTVDEVTGQVVKTTPWTATKTNYPEYIVPTIAGYTPSQSMVAKVTPKATDGNTTVDVTYTANQKTTNTVFKDQGNNNKVVKAIPVDGKKSVTIADYSKGVNPETNHDATRQLPQTGAANGQALSVLGLLTGSLTALLGVAKKKRERK